MRYMEVWLAYRPHNIHQHPRTRRLEDRNQRLFLCFDGEKGRDQWKKSNQALLNLLSKIENSQFKEIIIF